jgi:hypothetical protein
MVLHCYSATLGPWFASLTVYSDSTTVTGVHINTKTRTNVFPMGPFQLLWHTNQLSMCY